MRRNLAPLALLLAVAAGVGTYFLARRTEPRELVALRAALPLEELEPPLARRIDVLSVAILEDPNSPEAWGDLAFCLEVHDLRDGAIAAYGRAEELAPGDARWPYLLGHVQRIADPTASRASFLRAVEIDPAFLPALRHAGEGALIAGDLETASRCFDELAERGPEVPHGYSGRARVALARDDVDRALEQGEYALRFAPDSADVHAFLAEAYRRAELPARAEEHLAAAEQGAPMPITDPLRDGMGLVHGVTIHWRHERAALLTALGRPKDAVEEWRAARRDDPGSNEVARELAAALARAGRGAEGETLYRECIARDPTDARARHGLASLLVRRNETAEVIALLEEALRLDPGLHEARSTLGAVLFGEGRAAEAIAALEESARALPDRAEAAFNLGMAYRTVGRMEGAIRELARAIELDPAFIRARFELGVTYASAHRYDEAAEQFRAVTEIELDRVGAHRNLARVLARGGRAREALDVVARAAERFPDDTGLRWQEAWTRAVATDDSVRDLARAREIAGELDADPGPLSPSDLDTLRAALDAAAGDFAAALARIDAVISATEDPETRARLQEQREAYEAGRPWRE